jgi:uncharacterized surface protein with fasciclin (FAS1) repeats
MRKHSFRKMVAAAAMVAVPMTAIGVGSAGAAAPAGNMETSTSSTAKQNIVKVAAANEDFSTLVTAVKKAGLVKALSGKGPYTVFAPTNDAFAAVPTETLDSLLADKPALKNVLTYHVIKGKIMASDLQPTQTVETLNGDELTITVADGKATITDGQGNTVNITTTDIAAKNGVIHVIDGVLLPPSS